MRREVSGPALRAFFKIARAWQIRVIDERALLGWPPSSTFHKYKSGDCGTLAYDTLTRLSLVLGIYKSLHVLYPNARLADAWPRMPNTHRLFGTRAPIDLMTEGEIEALFQIRRLLDGRRQ